MKEYPRYLLLFPSWSSDPQRQCLFLDSTEKTQICLTNMFLHLKLSH